jgi:hypothetical protein
VKIRFSYKKRNLHEQDGTGHRIFRLYFPVADFMEFQAFLFGGVAPR